MLPVDVEGIGDLDEDAVLTRSQLVVAEGLSCEQLEDPFSLVVVAERAQLAVTSLDLLLFEGGGVAVELVAEMIEMARIEPTAARKQGAEMLALGSDVDPVGVGYAGEENRAHDDITDHVGLILGQERPRGAMDGGEALRLALPLEPEPLRDAHRAKVARIAEQGDAERRAVVCALPRPGRE